MVGFPIASDLYVFPRQYALSRSKERPSIRFQIDEIAVWVSPASLRHWHGAKFSGCDDPSILTLHRHTMGQRKCGVKYIHSHKFS